MLAQYICLIYEYLANALLKFSIFQDLLENDKVDFSIFISLNSFFHEWNIISNLNILYKNGNWDNYFGKCQDNKLYLNSWKCYKQMTDDRANMNIICFFNCIVSMLGKNGEYFGVRSQLIALYFVLFTTYKIPH